MLDNEQQFVMCIGKRRLRAQNLAVLERRYLRDLRSDALIEFK